MLLSDGTRLGPYEILAPLGAGGMGEVYRARDMRLNRDVALKILPPTFADDADRLRRFQLEAQAAGSLNHPNIVAVYDVGHSDGVAYVVTELLEGETLRERLQGSALPVRKAIEYGTQIARGLAAAHAKGVTHRDIKPENLFVTQDGFVKLLDFGLAKLSRAAGAGGLPATSAPTAALDTAPGVVMGTVGYMAPEQVKGAAVDHRSDVFSLGVVLYEMLASRRAFTGDSSVEIMSAIIREDPPDLPPGVPPVLERIVRRCLEKQPDQRFESARDLAFALESVSTGTGREKAVVGRRPVSKSLWIAAALLLAVAIAASGFFAGRRGWHEPSLRFRALTFRRGNILTANFANDGKTIIYSAAWDGKPAELFSTQESSPESRPLGIRNAYPSSISRNGDLALILSQDMRFGEAPGTLARVPVSGGAPREILEGVLYADWSPDGSQLAVVRGATSGQVLEYPIGNKIYETVGFIDGVRVSPRGDRIAFVDSPLSGDWAGSLVIIDTRGKKQAASTGRWVLNGFGWAPDGSEVWFSAFQPGASSDSLYAMDTRSRVRRIAELPGMYYLTDIGPDGRALMYQLATSNLAPFRAAGAAAETDLYWHDGSLVRDISPDGSYLLFSEGGLSNTSVDWDTYVRKTDGSPAVLLGKGLAMAFSPDGKWAMVNPNPDVTQPAQLLAYPLRAGSGRPLTADSIRHIAGRWLPDGERLVFVGVEPGHQLRYYVQDSMNARPRPISEEDVPFNRLADDIVISPDGKSIAALSRAGIQLLAVDGSGAHALPRAEPGVSPLAWCSDNSLLVFRPGELPARVMRVNLASGESRPWKQLSPAQRTGIGNVEPLRFLPDCETYAYSITFQLNTLYVASGIR
jgi:serine/threonine protein kinase/dipeptidyl aminopeptidase/acylaminoacyl peptidase